MSLRRTVKPHKRRAQERGLQPASARSATVGHAPTAAHSPCPTHLDFNDRVPSRRGASGPLSPQRGEGGRRPDEGWLRHVLRLTEPRSDSTTPTALRPPAQGWREATTLGQRSHEFTTPTGLRLFRSPNGRNPVGVENILTSYSQGSSFLATLGWRTESLWDSEHAHGWGLVFRPHGSNTIIASTRFPRSH
jgi:hypothetical protein